MARDPVGKSEHESVGKSGRDLVGKSERDQAGKSERDPVGKSIQVLMSLADNPTGPWSVRQIARQLDTSPATVHRIFHTFEVRHLLSRARDGSYQPGLELFRLCQALADNLSPVRIVRPHLEALAEECGEAVLLGAYDPARGEMVFLDMVQAVHPLQYMVELNSWMPVHAGATGLAILAFLPDAERERIYERGPDRLTEATLVSRAALEHEVGLIRERGYARSRGQRTTGAVGVAAPIFDSVGDVFGDVTITIPDQRFDERLEGVLATALRRTTAAVSDELRRAGCRRG